MWQKKFITLLKNNFEDAKARNPQFSARSFGKKIGLSSGAFSDLLNGKRRISFKKAELILTTLEVPEADIARLRKLLEMPQGTRVLLAEDAYEIVVKWHYLALLALFDMEKKPRDLETVRKKLDLSSEEMNESLKILKKHGLLVEDESGQLKSTGIAWSTKDGFSPQTLRDSHRNSLPLMDRALDLIPSENRDFVSLTFPADPKLLAQARKEVRSFCNKMARLMAESQNVSEVFRLSVQLFPVDQWDRYSKKE